MDITLQELESPRPHSIGFVEIQRRRQSLTVRRERAYAVLERIKHSGNNAIKLGCTSYLVRLFKFWEKGSGSLTRPLFDVTEAQLLHLVYYLYPARSDVQMEVQDFGEGRAEHVSTSLGTFDLYCSSKPSWSQVRWIHIPIGDGLVRRMLDYHFRVLGPRNFAFVEAGEPSWPYLELDLLSIHSNRVVQAFRDVGIILGTNPALRQRLNTNNFGDPDSFLSRTVQTWAETRGLSKDFWDCAIPEMPLQTSEDIGAGFSNANAGFRPYDRTIEKQLVSRHPFYDDGQVVRNRLDLFHRDDGYLLSCCAPPGITLLDGNFDSFAKELPYCRNEASSIAGVYRLFATTGTSTWNEKSVIWFTIFLAAEMIASPSTITAGNGAPSIENAYFFVFQELKRRRNKEWSKPSAISLVQDFSSLNDEVSSLIHHFNRQKRFLLRLRNDAVRLGLDNTNPESSPLGDTVQSIKKIDWAVAIVNVRLEKFSFLLDESRRTMDAFFQLISLEQNELAISAESTNKAILAFTLVTIVFLPLSFFTSYYGMNISSILNSTMTERHFWMICGMSTTLVVILSAAFAFREQLFLRKLSYLQNKKKVDWLHASQKNVGNSLAWT